MGRVYVLVLWVLAAYVMGVIEGCRPQVGPRSGCVMITRPMPPPRPTPEEVTDARRSFQRGVRFAEARRWGEALDAFRSAQRLVDHPVASYNVARTLWQLRRYEDVVSELAHFNVIYDLVRDRAMFERARELMERARALTGSLTLTVTPSNAVVHIDGVERSRLDARQREFTLDPGRHSVEVRAADRPLVRFTIRAQPRQRLARAVSLQGNTR